jgi:folate-dependent phosphoribosylglycinamide formyltransferase PurN
MTKPRTFILMTGSHPRHLYVAKQLIEANMIKAVVIETREHFNPAPPHNITALDRELFIKHFNERSTAEAHYFADLTVADIAKSVPTRVVSMQELNDENTQQWIANQAGTMLLSYGIHKVDDAIIDLFPPGNAWNIHGGLSPWYRGNTTLFWPFFFMQPHWAGMTIHLLTKVLDGGEIIHHSVPPLAMGDGIHDVACKAVIQVTKDIMEIIQKTPWGEPIPSFKQKSSGKLFVSADWQPHHLRTIYHYFNNDIVDCFLRGELPGKHPNLIRNPYVGGA